MKAKKSLFVFSILLRCDSSHAIMPCYMLRSFVTFLKCTRFMHLRKTDQYYLRTDCEMTSGQIFTSLVSYKIPKLSASFPPNQSILSLQLFKIFKI